MRAALVAIAGAAGALTRYALGLAEPYPRGYLAQIIQPFLPARARAARSARVEACRIYAKESVGSATVAR